MLNIRIIFPWWRSDKKETCERKVRYGHLLTALKAIQAMEKKGASGLEPYRCRHCSGYHIGH